jgi:hypothetical protein
LDVGHSLFLGFWLIGDFLSPAAAAGVVMSGGAGFHYDEALGRSKQPYVAFSWNEI